MNRQIVLQGCQYSKNQALHATRFCTVLFVIPYRRSHLLLDRDLAEKKVTVTLCPDAFAGAKSPCWSGTALHCMPFLGRRNGETVSLSRRLHPSH